MKIIGLTGPSGAGKGALSARFVARGIPAVDTDRVYHELLVPPSPVLDALCREFSPAILAPDGTLDRKALAALVFVGGEVGRARAAALNRITHGAVIARTLELLAAYEAEGAVAAVIDAPLLIEAGLNTRCDLVVAVLADRDVRLARLLAREGKSPAALAARLDAQPEDTFYRTHADVVVYNHEKGTAALDAAVSDILARLEVSL